MCVYVCERVGLRKHHSEVYGRRLYLVNNRMKMGTTVAGAAFLCGCASVEQLGYLPAAAAAAAPPRIVVHHRLLSGTAVPI